MRIPAAWPNVGAHEGAARPRANRANRAAEGDGTIEPAGKPRDRGRWSPFSSSRPSRARLPVPRARLTSAGAAGQSGERAAKGDGIDDSSGPRRGRGAIELRCWPVLEYYAERGCFPLPRPDLIDREFRCGNVREESLLEICGPDGLLGRLARLDFRELGRADTHLAALAQPNTCMGDVFAQIRLQPSWYSLALVQISGMGSGAIRP
ncbi:hypothetical protein SBA4_6950003 [Candidatus Sulfopaludibacter sp. SbA4]|nr:hypothetical protein SBA4_6950003 [Candidatus Sulfopaludibacter sp. SbA4]